MDVTGIIFASVDCDADAVEAWNRWYDLEHLPPNIALPGIMTGKRYVAPPELHDVREPADRLEGFADGRGVHVTVYTLGGRSGAGARRHDHLPRQAGSGRAHVRPGEEDRAGR